MSDAITSQSGYKHTVCENRSGATQRDLHMYGAVRKKPTRDKGEDIGPNVAAVSLVLLRPSGGWSSSGNQGRSVYSLLLPGAAEHTNPLHTLSKTQ